MSGNESTAKTEDGRPEVEEAVAPEAQKGVSEADRPVGEPAADGVGEPDEPTAEELAAALEIARGEAEQQRDAVLRAQAEMENLRKRSAREVENAHKFGIERLISDLLPIKDSMELGLAAAAGEGATVESLRDGSELTLKMLVTVLEKYNVEEIDPDGAAFDPEFHQAMSVQAVEGKETGTVVQVVQKGYRLNGRLVRPAMVIVAE